MTARATGFGALAAVFAAAAVAGAAPSAPPGLHFVPLVTGYDAPVGLAVAPGEPDRLYVVEQRGRVLVVQHGSPVARPFLDIRARVRQAPLLGLLGLAFDPRYRSNHRFYLLYTGRGGREYVVSMVEKDGVGQPTAARILLRVAGSPKPFSHVGGQLAFGPDGRLYVGVGDGLRPGDAQDLRSPLGKILALDVRRPVAQPSVVAYGLRNPWRFSFDRRTGALFVGDVGDASWEEIDVLRSTTRAAVNFGWPIFEGPKRRRPDNSSSGDVTAPAAVYPHRGQNCRAVIGGYVYRGPVVALRGRYLFGDLCTGHVLSFEAGSGQRVVLRREAASLPGLTSFGEDARGTLYATTEGGVVYRIAWSAP